MKIIDKLVKQVGLLLALALLSGCATSSPSKSSCCGCAADPAKVSARPFEAKPAHPYFAKFQLKKAPVYGTSYLKPGDRLAICGDSITEQKMYSRILETYLTVALPELNISVRQYGWGGETASGFLARMTNDCLRFKPTVATTCYGMNDHRYRAYEPEIGRLYREQSTAIVEAFKSAGVRVVQGSPGCVGKNPNWSQDKKATMEDLNLNLAELRGIGIEIAQSEQVRFADVFWPMLQAGWLAQNRYQTNYAIAGGDGVHPGWAGHLVMAYAFLRGLGVPGDIGTFTVDLKAKQATVSPGHDLVSFDAGQLKITSHRYPFCAAGDIGRDDQIRSGMSLVPFNREFNRLLLVVKNGKARSYRVTWGGESRIFSAQQLAQGVNLAEEFAVNPFSEAFAKVDAAVKAKQDFETVQIKQKFHGADGKADLEATVERTEKERLPLAEAVKAALVPVTHTIGIEPQ